MVPLRVTAIMDKPVAYSGDGMHLDGPVAVAAYRLLTPEQRAQVPPYPVEFATDFDLPLARWSAPYGGACDARLRDSDGNVWGWQCSAVHAHWLGRGTRYVVKATAVTEMARRTDSPSLNTAGGEFKRQHLPHQMRYAHRLVWYAVGDPDGLRVHLDQVPSIGKLASMGPGRVRDWIIEPCPEARQLWRRRTLPAPPGYRGIVASIRAPYHHSSREIECVLPRFDALAPSGSEGAVAC